MDVRLPYRVGVRPSVIRSITGFTLVELMVVLVIVALLASLTLAGLSGVRQRAKEDKTRSTIRKIDSVIQPMYASYATRRVPSTVPRATLLAAPQPRRLLATNRLQNLRLLMAVEMPDNWPDVGSAAVPSFAQNNLYRRYAATKASINALVPPSDPRFRMYEQAETLMMILAISGYEPGCMEQFRNDEIGDIDGDGAKEFADGWGRPIAFFRWPAAFDSPFNDLATPDPLDVMRVTRPPAAAHGDRHRPPRPRRHGRRLGRRRARAGPGPPLRPLHFSPRPRPAHLAQLWHAHARVVRHQVARGHRPA